MVVWREEEAGKERVVAATKKVRKDAGERSVTHAGQDRLVSQTERWTRQDQGEGDGGTAVVRSVVGMHGGLAMTQAGQGMSR